MYFTASFRRFGLLLAAASALLVNAFATRLPAEEEQDPPPDEQPAEKKEAPKPRPLQIDKPEHPYKIPEGPGRAGWETFLKNDLEGAEKAFNDALGQTPSDLETLEGLRAVCIAGGRYGEAQKFNLRMIGASTDKPLCGLIAMRAMDTLAYTESRADLIAVLKETSEKAGPAVRASLRDILASLYMGMDKPAEAREALKGLGYVDSWLFLAGSFGTKDRNNKMDRRFAPERALKDLSFKDERGKPVKVLRDVKANMRSLDVRRLLPDERGIVYAFTNLESESDQEILLVLGAPYGTRAFLRGVPIYQETMDKQYIRETPILKTQLRKGANPLLVKLPFAADLVVRVFDANYAPAQGVSVKSLDANALAAHEVVALRGYLFSEETTGMSAAKFLEPLAPEERAKGLRGVALNGSLSAAQAIWLDLSAQQENDVPAREAIARTLVGSFPDSIGPLDQGAVILAAAGRSAGHTDSRNAEDARQLRERALEKVPKAHQHLLGLYYFYADRGLKDQAFDMIKACADAHPKSALAQERLGQMYLEKRLPVQSERQLEKAAELDAAYLGSLARFHETQGNRVRGRELREKMRALGQELPMQEYTRFVTLGKYDVAEKLLAEQEKNYPERAEDFQETRAELLAEKGDLNGAYELRKKMLAAKPKNTDALHTLVDLSLRMGKDEEAKDLLRKHLKEHPGDYAARRRLRELEGKEKLDWWAPYDVQVAAIDTSKFNQDNYPRSNHAWIVDFMVTKILPDLSRESYVHIAQKVINNEGIGELSETIVRAQRQDVVFIRTLNPDGSIYQPTNVHDFDLVKSASFYKVGPGSILEHAYLMNEDADEDEPRLNAAFNFMALDAPRAVSRWVVMVPKNSKLTIRKVCPELIDEKILPGPEGYTVYQWTNKQVEGIKVEPFMPVENDQEVIPLIFIESPENRFRATGWLTRRTKYFLPEPAAAQAQTLTAQPKGEEAKFRAIVEWVRSNIQPGKEANSLEDVWTLRSGNTGQMTELALAMCQSAGLPVTEALVNGSYVPGQVWRTKNAKREWEPGYFASFGGSGRMMVLEPARGTDVWMQFAGQPSKYFNAGDLFDGQPGRLALVATDEGVRIKRVDGEAQGKVTADHRMNVTLDAQGQGHVKGTLQLFGFVGGQVRQFLDDPRKADQVREGIVRRFWPKLEEPAIRVEGKDNPADPLCFAYTGLVKDLAAPAEASLFLQPFRAPAFLLELMGPPERIHDLLIKQEYSELDNSVSYDLPHGYGWTEVPDDAFFCTEFGFYIADFNVKGGRLTCNRSFLVPMQRVTPDKYPKLMEFLNLIAEVERQRVAYSKISYPGFTAAPRTFLSIGYASNGDELDEKKEQEKQGKPAEPAAAAQAKEGPPAPPKAANDVKNNE
ncbi:MAG: tetratricopeptide repeat protein [Planctomycetes bacterium]|nr:tetratricopeptide repeat protein [Planctomycetota bacterium]